jgi:hypothetical protein
MTPRTRGIALSSAIKDELGRIIERILMLLVVFRVFPLGISARDDHVQ